MKQTQHHRGWRVIASVAAALTMLFSVAACGQDSASDTTANKDSASHSSKDSSESSKSSSSDKNAKKPVPHGKNECTAAQLTASLTQGQGGGAGSVYPYLVLTNSSENTCTIKGYPGVSLRAGDQQIGAPAERDASVPAKTITLKKGESAHAALQITQAGNYDSATCSPKQATSMMIYPPNQKESLSIATSDYTGCASSSVKLLTIRAFEKGKG